MKQDIIIAAHQTEGVAELEQFLSNYEMDVTYYTDVFDVEARLAVHSPAFLLLDYDLAGMDFLLNEIMASFFRPHPYIIVAAHFPDGVVRASLLRQGADTCIEKPTVAEEVLAVIEAVLRRERRNTWFHQGAHLPCVEYLELKIDPLRRQTIMRGKEITLTVKEFEILYFLAYRAGTVLTKEEIYKMFGTLTSICQHLLSRTTSLLFEKSWAFPVRIMITSKLFLASDTVSEKQMLIRPNSHQTVVFY